jgi:hypothetical protein
MRLASAAGAIVGAAAAAFGRRRKLVRVITTAIAIAVAVAVAVLSTTTSLPLQTIDIVLVVIFVALLSHGDVPQRARLAADRPADFFVTVSVHRLMTTLKKREPVFLKSSQLVRQKQVVPPN